MKVYHGSTVVVDSPEIMQSERLLDFGMGFYTTTNLEQATRWALKVSARRNANEKFISVYEFNDEHARQELTIIQFESANEDWLDFICACRSGRGVQTEYDIVIGPVADDNVYATVQFYELGVYDKPETLKRLKVEELYNQILFHTDRALQYCTFTEAIEIGGNAHGR